MKGQKLPAKHNASKGRLSKRKIIYIVSSLVLVVFALFVIYFVRSAKKIKIIYKDFKFAAYKFTLKDLLNIYMNGLDATVSLVAQNFSNVTFSVSQISIDIYTLDNILVASQKAPMVNPIEITAKSNTPIPILYNFSKSGIIALGKGGDYWSIMKDFALKGVFGKKIILKGFVVANNINISINETVDI